WNDRYQNYFLEEDVDSPYLVLHFEETVSTNLNLSDIYFLTTGHSASASELTIIGLDPYMNVTTIGENTYGKCYGSFTFDDIEDPPRHNWAMQPLVFKYANVEGFTDFTDGLVPDIFVEDNLFNATEFGDMADPLLARALEEITGVSPLSRKMLPKPVDYERLPDPLIDRKNVTISNLKLPRFK
ncbi:peptidase S41, partial [Bacteroidota bacterium]